MGQIKRFFFVVASLLLLFGPHTAEAAIITSSWLGGEVSISHPDSVIIGETFDISFSVDASMLPPSGWALAFKTFLDTSDTIELTNSTWEYVFSSDDPDWDLSFSGDLGDATTPITQGAGGNSVRLFDPVNGERTWIWGDQNDKVTWTLQDIVFLDDTSFTLTLDEYFAVPTAFDFEVTEGSYSVPALSLPARMATVLLFLAVAYHTVSAGRRSTLIHKES